MKRFITHIPSANTILMCQQRSHSSRATPHSKIWTLAVASEIAQTGNIVRH